MTLTNSPPDKDGSPLESAGLAHFFFERQFSVDSVRRFKPAPEAYHLVTELLNVGPSVICLVAAHTLGHSRRTECRFLSRTCDQYRKCSAANRWASATSGCSDRSCEAGKADDCFVALTAACLRRACSQSPCQISGVCSVCSIG